MTSIVRVALVAGFALIAAPAVASTTSFNSDSVPAAKATGLKLAQGATPEGWRVEGPPRYKKATTKSKMDEVTKFREEPMHYKKKKTTTTGSSAPGSSANE
jgi:hypothetical protein